MQWKKGLGLRVKSTVGKGSLKEVLSKVPQVYQNQARLTRYYVYKLAEPEGFMCDGPFGGPARDWRKEFGPWSGIM
jgi:hypothetical protein